MNRKLGTTEVSRIIGMSRCNLGIICRAKKAKLNKHRYEFYLYEWMKILDDEQFNTLEEFFKDKPGNIFQEIIYVTRTTEIYHSKMNQ